MGDDVFQVSELFVGIFKIDVCFFKFVVHIWKSLRGAS